MSSHILTLTSDRIAEFFHYQHWKESQVNQYSEIFPALLVSIERYYADDNYLDRTSVLLITDASKRIHERQLSFHKTDDGLKNIFT